MCMGMRGSLRYQKYGKATTCKNGKGYSAYANDVYSIGGENEMIDNHLHSCLGVTKSFNGRTMKKNSESVDLIFKEIRTIIFLLKSGIF